MTFDRDWAFRVATGQERHHWAVNKFGHAPNGVQTTETDIWDRADATPTQQVHVVPTQPRIHNIVSSSIADDLGSTGATHIKIWGVTSWVDDHDSPEHSEEIIMNGQTPVATVGEYVFIHRIRVTNTGSGNVNAGTITATAATDGTISAAILPGNGSTQMAMLAVPPGYQHWMFNLNAAVSKSSGGAASINYEIYDDDYSNSTNAATLLAAKNVRDEISVQSTGTSTVLMDYKFPLRFTGPCVIRIAGFASAADLDGIVTWDGVTTKKIFQPPVG